MKVLCYDLVTGVAGVAVRDSGHTLVGYLRGQSMGEPERHSTAPRMLQASVMEAVDADIIITSCPITLPRRVRSVAKAAKAQHVLWDLGNCKPRKCDLNMVSVPLQIEGYEVTLLSGVSCSALGYNYKEDRWFLWATKGGIPLLPPKLMLKTPFMMLDDILDSENDPIAIPIYARGRTFHKEHRAWNFLGKVYGNTHLKHHSLSTIVGTVWYVWEGRIHRIQPDEAATMVGVPMGLDELILTSCPTPALATYVTLKDAGYPVWMDMIERTIGYDNC